MVGVADQLATDPAARLRAAAGGAANVDEALRVVVLGLLDGLKVPHTDLDAVASRLGVRLQGERGLPFSAILSADDNGLKVTWAVEQNERRRRFTIAHELAHAFLETHGSGEPPRSGDAVESLCDRFAAELLMPAHLFQAELARGLTLERLFDLSTRYRTSLRATAIRCSRLTEIAVFVADGRDLLWSKSDHATYNDFLRQVVTDLLANRRPVSCGAVLNRRGVEEEWRLEGDVLPHSGDAILLLTPDRS